MAKTRSQAGKRRKPQRGPKRKDHENPYHGETAYHQRSASASTPAAPRRVSWIYIFAICSVGVVLVLELALIYYVYSMVDAKIGDATVEINAKVNVAVTNLEELTQLTERLTKGMETGQKKIARLSNRVNETRSLTAEALSKVIHYITEVNDKHGELLEWLQRNDNNSKRCQADIADIRETIRTLQQQYQDDMARLHADREHSRSPRGSEREIQQYGKGPSFLPIVVEGIGSVVKYAYPPAAPVVNFVVKVVSTLL